LVTTTALLVAGFGALGFSQAPMMSLFGGLGSLVIVVALLDDIVLLPALLVASDRTGWTRIAPDQEGPDKEVSLTY